MKKIAIGLALLLPAIALAGAKYTSNVYLSSTYAYGSLGSARKSANIQEYIGCSTVTQTTSDYVQCYARDVAGTVRSCWSSNAALIASARAIGPASYVYFGWSSTGECTQVTVHNFSYSEPMTP